MKIFATFAAVAVAASATVPLTASAQTYLGMIYDRAAPVGGAPARNVSDLENPAFRGGGYGALPPYEVLTIVRSMGFEPQNRPLLRGRVYIVQAFDDQDVPVRVDVDALSGRVMNVAELDAMPDDGPAIEGDRYGAYPVPPRSVPSSGAYREPYYRRPDYRAPDYRAPADRSSDGRIYTPAPYAPSATTQSVARRPRVASRTPIKTAPTPRVRPPAATTMTAVPTPEATPKDAATPPATTTTKSAVAQDAARHGTSIPAPVASRKSAPPPEAAPPAAKPEAPAAQPSGDTPLVPVAPLE